MYRYVQYHSRDWRDLVEQGWVTDIIDHLSDGTRIARMIFVGRSRRG